MYSSSTCPKIVEPYMSISAQNIVADNCRHCGYIRKEGDRIKTWTNRYTVLHKGCIYYFADAEDPSAKGQFSLNGYSLSAAPEKTKFKWTFKLVNIQPEKRTYYFAAHSEREMVEWTDMIRKEIDEISGLTNKDEDLPEYHYPEVHALFPSGNSPRLQRSPVTLDESSTGYYQDIKNQNAPEYCPPPDVSPIQSPRDCLRVPYPTTSCRPASVAWASTYPCPPKRSQSAQNLRDELPKLSRPLPIPRQQTSPQCNESDLYDNDDENVQPTKEKYQNKLRDRAKMSVGSLGLEERHLHQSAKIGHRNQAAQARLIEPIQPALPKAATRLPGKAAISLPMPFPFSSQDQSAKSSKPKPSAAVKPQISQPLPYPRPAAVPPPRPPRKPAVSPKPSSHISPVQKASTEPRRYSNKEFAKNFIDELSTTLPRQGKNSLSGSESDDSDEEYLKVVPETCPDNNNLPNVGLALERGRPEGMSKKTPIFERNLLPPSAERLDLDKITILPLFDGRIDGLYLIHSSRSAETKKALSVWTCQQVRHFLIFFDKVEGYALDPAGPRFDTILNLLDYYYHNTLPRCSTKLTEPCKT